MARKLTATPRPELTPDQKAEADRFFEILQKAVETDLRAICEQLATTTDRTIFGDNEFVLRDMVHGIAAKSLETALNERKKGGTEGRASSVPAVKTTSVLSAGMRKPSRRSSAM